MEIIIAVALGLGFGVLQFFLLWEGIQSMIRGKLNPIYFIVQFFCPFVGLGLCVYLAKDYLVLSGTIICSILFIGAAVYKIYIQKQDRKRV